ncbi:PD-(D/E)XK nuclease family protein [Streptomyces sp. NPDC004610]|uniref:PD-(D/E)XK nuclease family protein n=1 Tax=unclassified Streptomyces TaxID=2593676 RepID=UPI0033AF05DB
MEHSIKANATERHMATWTPPPGSTWPTSNRLIRMFAGSSLRQDSGRCPYRTAMKARTGLRLPRGPLATYKTDPRETFNLGPTGTALDLIEHDGIEPEEALGRALAATAEHPEADPGLTAWTRFAVEHFLRGRPRDLLPLAGTWIVVTKLERQDARGAKRYEQCVWGRSYISADGRVRELCVPVARHKDELRSDRNADDDADRADRAAAAYVVGFGHPYRLPGQRSWSSDAQPLQDAGEAARSRPQEVRISEVSCLDGTRRELLRDSIAEIERRYADHGAPQLTAAVSGNTFLPGNDCADCRYAPTCPALNRLGGILGIEDDTKPRRSWSVTNGRSYMGRPGRDESCPARERLRRLRLPDPEGRSLTPQVVRGHAVHAWIQERHENHPGVACRPEDAPDGRTSWSVGRWTVPQEQAELGAQMVAAHARHCPYRLSSVDEVIHERTLVLHDTAADVLVIAKTDMLYRDGPSWVYRETKTDARRRPPMDTGTGIFRERPQLALAVLLSTSSLVNDDTSGARVELEVLGPAGGLTIIDPFDPENRTAARQAIHELSAAWHADTTAPARPGAHCLTCDMAAWCRPIAPSELLAPEG